MDGISFFETDKIETGMLVEATNGDLGEGDLTKPKVANIIYNEDGNVETIVVEKGFFFKKKIEVPADRIQEIQEPTHENSHGKVIIATTEREIEALAPGGIESLLPLRSLDAGIAAA